MAHEKLKPAGAGAPNTDFPPGLSQPALRALGGAGYTRLDQLTTVTEAELLTLHGFGPSGLRVLRAALDARGLAFARVDQKRKP